MGDTLLELGGAIVLNLERAKLPPNLVDWYNSHKSDIPEAIRRGFVWPEECRPEPPKPVETSLVPSFFGKRYDLPLDLGP